MGLNTLGTKMIDPKEMIGVVLRKAGKGENLSYSDFLVLFLDSISLRLSDDFFTSRFSYIPGTDLEPEIKKILVIHLFSIGDVVYATPVIQALREHYPKAFISFLVEEAAYPVVEDNPYLDEVIVLPSKKWQSLLDKGNNFKEVLAELHHFILNLKEKEYDYIANLHLSPRSAIITHLACAKYESGISLKEDGSSLVRGNLWNLYKYLIGVEPEMRDYNQTNQAERCLRMVLLENKPREVRFFISEEKEKKVRAILDRLEIGEKDLVVGLNPGANYPARRWLPERFGLLADLLIKEFYASVIIFGGPTDVELANKITGLMEETAINLAGTTSLPELAGMIKRCDHLITNDTGPMHIAGSVGTKVIAINGPTLVGPCGGEDHLLLQADIPCIGCGDNLITCTKGDCMRAIEVEDVLAALKYQRGEIPHSAFRIPHSDKVNVYTSGNTPNKRLSNYYPLKAHIPGAIARDLLRFGHLSLWMAENDRLGFKEEHLSLKEVNQELTKRHGKEALREAIEDVKEIIQALEEYRKNLKQILSLESPISSLSSLDPRIEKFFKLFHLLFTGKTYSKERLLRFCEWKVQAVLFLENFLKPWTEK